MAETNITLKLLVDTNTNKVLFAEGNKDFVDFLLHILSLPIATVVDLLADKGVVGCVADLYKSVDSLSSDYWISYTNKDSVLNPTSSVSVPLLSLESNDTTTTTSVTLNKRLWICKSHPNKVTDHYGRQCQYEHYCGNIMGYEVTYVGSGKIIATSSNTDASGGYVKGVVTYMIMDNLEVKPMSTISGITLINKFNVKDVGSLIEKQVQVDFSEGLEILKASFETRAVLTTVFLDK